MCCSLAGWSPIPRFPGGYVPRTTGSIDPYPLFPLPVPMPTPAKMLEDEIRAVLHRCIAEGDLTYSQAITVLEVEKHRLIVQMLAEESGDESKG